MVAAGGVRRHHQSVDRRPRRAGAARARHAGAAASPISERTRDVRALQPDRRAGDRRGRARRGGCRIFLAAAGIDRISAFKLMFYAYAALGLVGAALYRRLPHAQMRAGGARARRSGPRAAWSTSSPRCSASTPSPAASRCNRCWRCGCSSASTCRCRAASLFFFWSSALARVLLSGRGLARQAHRPVNTMVFTHIPSSVFLILAAFSPDLYLTLALLLLRAALSQMDVPTRTSYVMAVVTPAERAAAASVTAVPRSLASAVSPALRRRAAGHAVLRPAAGGLRRAEDRLRRGAAVVVPAHQAAGGAPLEAPLRRRGACPGKSLPRT